VRRAAPQREYRVARGASGAAATCGGAGPFPTYRSFDVPSSFLSVLTGSFASPAAENTTVALIEAAYGHHDVDARYINCDVAPSALGDAVRGARAMGWAGFNCSIPQGRHDRSSRRPRRLGGGDRRR
jgi:hypothetical protein